jgi:hypothetical protein
MQRGRWELLPGIVDGDDLIFETEFTPYRDKTGRWRFRGPDVQGPPNEPFLYLSWRVTGRHSWIMRAKVDLSPLTEEFLVGVPDGAVLETPVYKLGGRDRRQAQEWRIT